MAVLALVVAGVVASASCGGDSARDASAGAGKSVFIEAGCGSCHTLAAADTRGTAGPNLDERQPDYDAVVRQVSNGGVGMPSFAGKLSKADIRRVAAFVAQAASSSGKSGSFVPDETTLASCSDDACYEQAFGNVAYRAGPRTALARLDAEARRNPLVDGNCHQITHEIGHAAYARFRGDAARALGEGTMTCWSGYYHGVIEEAFGGIPRSRVAATARGLCSAPSVRRTTFITYQCVHGLGHGLMIYSGNDLLYALDVCHQLADEWSRTSCTGGVFMQNFLPPSMGQRTKWLRRDNLLYPCDVVEPRDKLYCYLSVTSRILRAVKFDWQRAAQWCRRAEPDWAYACFRSLGRDASGHTRGSVPEIVAICRLADGMERECVYGAAQDLTANDADGKRASALCRKVAEAIRAHCFTAVGAVLGGFHTYRGERRAACDEVTPPAYRRACYEGAVA